MLKKKTPTVCLSLTSFPEGRIYSRKALDPHWQVACLNKLLSIVVQNLPMACMRDRSITKSWKITHKSVYIPVLRENLVESGYWSEKNNSIHCQDKKMSTCAFQKIYCQKKTTHHRQRRGPTSLYHHKKLLAYTGLASQSKTHVADSYSHLRPQSAIQCQYPCPRWPPFWICIRRRRLSWVALWVHRRQLAYTSKR